MEYAIELNKMTQQQRDCSGLDNDAIIRLAELKDRKLIPNQLTPTQLYNVKHIGIYQYLIKGLTTFADIEYLPKLSDAALLMLSYKSLQTTIKSNMINALVNTTFKARLYKLIDDADNGLSVDLIIENIQRPRKYRLWSYVSLGLLSLLTIMASYLYYLSLIKDRTAANANKIKIVVQVIKASYIAIFTLLLGLPLIAMEFTNRGLLWLKDYFSAIDTKVHQLPEHPVGDYYHSGLQYLDSSQSLVNPLELLVQKGILTKEFNEKGDIDNTQLVSLSHPAILTMLTANEYAVHLSSFLQMVGKISKHQAHVLSNATLYAPFKWSLPFNFKSNAKTLRKLIQQSDNQDAMMIVKKQRRGYLLKGVVFAGVLSAIYPILSQTKTLPSRTLEHILNPFIALLTSFVIFPLLGKLHNLMRECFCAKRKKIEDFVFIKGREGPEKILHIEKESKEQDIEAGQTELSNQYPIEGAGSKTSHPIQITLNNSFGMDISIGVGSGAGSNADNTLSQPLLLSKRLSEGSRGLTSTSSSNGSRLTQ